MIALSLCINYEIAMRKKTAVCIGIANCAANVFYLVILALKKNKKGKKKTKKRSHTIHADVWVSWAWPGWGTGDNIRFWITNCNIENRLFLCYH